MAESHGELLLWTGSKRADTKVLVTGGSGYVASVLIRDLLKLGYQVRATVRSVSNEDKVSHLRHLADHTSGRLELAEADLLVPGSFDKAVEGCTFVCHTASPFVLKVADAQKDLIEPAVHGTENVLLAVAKHKQQVRRVVLTSSVAAVRSAGQQPGNGRKLFNEEDWNQNSTAENGPYMYSKRLAEEAGWKLAKEHGFDLVVINPSFVIGPPASGRVDGTSVSWMQSLLRGEVRPQLLPLVDVRNVSEAHIAAMERQGAKGRHIVSYSRPVKPGDIARAIKTALPKSKLNVDAMSKSDQEFEDVVDNSKSRTELGIHFIDPCQSAADMAVAFVELGISKL